MMSSPACRAEANILTPLSRSAGLREVDTWADVVDQADMILSILPPAAAIDLASGIAALMQELGKTPLYVDCNAVSPDTAQKVAAIITAAGAPVYRYRHHWYGTRQSCQQRGAAFLCFRSRTERPCWLWDGQGIRVIEAGENYGEASGLKMTYAGLTKGTWTLHTAVLLAAKRLGVLDTLLQEFAFSQSAALSAMRAQVPFIPADSERWIGEMEEIASTLSDAGVTSGFHDGAAEIFRLLAKTPLARETRADMDRSRSLEDALSIYEEYLPKQDQ